MLKGVLEGVLMAVIVLLPSKYSVTRSWYLKALRDNRSLWAMARKGGGVRGGQRGVERVCERVCVDRVFEGSKGQSIAAAQRV